MFLVLFLSSLSVWASSGQLQAAQCPDHIGGMESHRFQCVCRVWSRRRYQPMGSVGGVMWHKWTSWKLKEASSTIAVLASGPERGQGAPLASADPGHSHLHCAVRIQCVQDYFSVKVVLCLMAIVKIMLNNIIMTLIVFFGLINTFDSRSSGLCFKI